MANLSQQAIVAQLAAPPIKDQASVLSVRTLCMQLWRAVWVYMDRFERCDAGQVKVRQNFDAPVSASVSFDEQHGLLYVATLAGNLLCYEAAAVSSSLR